MKIIIEGAGQVGSHLAKMLSHEGGDITVIDDNEARLQRLNATADVVTILGDPSSIKVLREAGCAKADLFIAVNPATTQTVNIVSSLLAKRLGSKRVIARVDDEAYLLPENKLIFKDMGLDMLFYPEKIASDEIIDLLKHTASTDSMDFARGKLQLVVFRLDDDSPILDMKVAEDDGRLVGGPAPHHRHRPQGRDHHPEVRHPVRVQRPPVHHRQAGRRPGHPEIPGQGQHRGEQGDDPRRQRDRRDGRGPAPPPAAGRGEDHRHRQAGCRELTEKLSGSLLVANGDARNSDFLVEEGIRDYDALVAVTGNDEANILSCVVAKKFGVSRTVAQVENLEYLRLAEDMGVDAVINKKLITAGRIFKFTLSDKVRFVRYMSGTDAEVLEYTVAPGARITKAMLKDIDFPRNAIIGGVIRGSESFIAVGDTRIEPYDRVAVFALPDTVKEVDKFFK